MHIRPKPHVIGQVPAGVVRILVENDVVGAPQPSIAKWVIVGRDAEVETAKPKPRRTASAQVPYMLGPKAAVEMSMLPRMVEMVVWVVRPGVMTDPLAASIDVGRVGVSRLVVVLRGGMGRAVICFRAMCRRRRMAAAPCPPPPCCAHAGSRNICDIAKNASVGFIFTSREVDANFRTRVSTSAEAKTSMRFLPDHFVL